MPLGKYASSLLAACCWPVCLAAQIDPQLADVAGAVYDSVARRALAGAVVQLVDPASPASIWSVGTDAQGRFRIARVPPGRYVIGFQHHALDSLALEPPLQGVQATAGRTTQVDLAIPSPARIIALVCRRPANDSASLVIGLLNDGRTRLPVDSGVVEIRWSELVIDSSGMRQQLRSARAAVGDNGWYALCGVPIVSDLLIFARRGSDTSGTSFVDVPPKAVVRRDLFVGGMARVAGRVISEKNQPIQNARLMVAGYDRGAITDSTGVFRLDSVKAGTQTLEIRALGYAPERRTLMLAANGDTSVTITLTTLSRVMDTIRVVGQRLYDIDREGFQSRKRIGVGRFFDQDDVRRKGVHDVSQLLNDVPSVLVRYSGLERSILMRDVIDGSYCVPDLWVNGMRMPREVVTDIDLIARPEEIVGMEVYRGNQTPAQFTSTAFDQCGTIVLWTRIPSKPKK